MNGFPTNGIPDMASYFGGNADTVPCVWHGVPYLNHVTYSSNDRGPVSQQLPLTDRWRASLQAVYLTVVW